MTVTKDLFSAVFPALLCVWLATTHVSAEEYRIDAEQEGYTQVTLSRGSGEPISDLFGDCLALGRTIDAMYESIAMGSVEYVRYVPDSGQITTVGAQWAAPTGSVTVDSIEDCAMVANDEGANMFKYDGGSDCLLSSQTYDLMENPDCESDETDAVFVLSEEEDEDENEDETTPPITTTEPPTTPPPTTTTVATTTTERCSWFMFWC